MGTQQSLEISRGLTLPQTLPGTGPTHSSTLSCTWNNTWSELRGVMPFARIVVGPIEIGDDSRALANGKARQTWGGGGRKKRA